MQRGGRTLDLLLRPQLDKSSGAGRIGIYSWRDLLVEKVTPGGAAAIAGLAPGDRIVSASGAPVRHWTDLEQLLQNRPAGVVLGVQRGSRLLRSACQACNVLGRIQSCAHFVHERAVISIGANLAAQIAGGYKPDFMIELPRQEFDFAC